MASKEEDGAVDEERPENSINRSQADKFRDLAREVEADEDEQAFKDKLRQMRSSNTTGKEKTLDDGNDGNS